ncbi:MAG: hypothetical protein ABH833_04240 [Parcubacteria group bacterium]
MKESVSTHRHARKESSFIWKRAESSFVGFLFGLISRAKEYKNYTVANVAFAFLLDYCFNRIRPPDLCMLRAEYIFDKGVSEYFVGVTDRYDLVSLTCRASGCVHVIPVPLLTQETICASLKVSLLNMATAQKVDCFEETEVKKVEPLQEYFQEYFKEDANLLLTLLGEKEIERVALLYLQEGEECVDRLQRMIDGTFEVPPPEEEYKEEE